MTDLRAITATAAAVYFENNRVQPEAIGDVIMALARSLAEVGQPETTAAPEPAQPTGKTKAEIKKSITPDALISFEDGKRYRNLTRHLAGRGMTADEYRAKHELGRDYPMSAPNSTAARSAAAIARGFGKRPEPEPAAPPTPEPKAKRAPRKAKSETPAAPEVEDDGGMIDEPVRVPYPPEF